jgi:small subunit ribosomal protein S20
LSIGRNLDILHRRLSASGRQRPRRTRRRFSVTGRTTSTDFERGFRVANIKSQIKRNKQNERRRQRNKAVKSSLKTYVRNFREAADAGDADTATAAMRAACKELDKAASKGVIHKNQAANRKSAITKRAAELQSA